MELYGVRNNEMRDQVGKYHAEFLEIYPQFADREITVKLNKSMRTRGGTASYRDSDIKLNYRLFLKYPKKLRQTYGHELAHLISFWLHGDEGRGHGFRWKEIMLKLGLEPQRCHKMKTKRARWKRYPAYCACEGKTFKLTKTKYYRVEQYKCRTCHEPLRHKKKIVA